MRNNTKIFDIQNQAEFEILALETFVYQHQNCAIYREYCDYLKINPAKITQIEQIPFLPIESFKLHKISDEQMPNPILFESSGTGNMQRSKHYIGDTNIYKTSIQKAFEQFIGPAQDFVFLGLLPSYLEKNNSSLIYMVDELMQLSNQPENAYYLYDHQKLNECLKVLEWQKKPYVLFGVSFALLDFIDDFPQKKLAHGIVIETGGMKGRKTEMGKNELLEILEKGLSGAKIYSEYSMCELQSQAYSLGQNIYQCPPWMQVHLRDLEDPFAYVAQGRTGAINVIDLANWHSCSFVASQDLGRKYGQNFEVLGRIDHSDIRGCSLLVV